MSTTTLSDTEIKGEVLKELNFEPSVNAAHIGVSVKDGIVTLSGHASSLAEVYAAEKAAKRIHGVRAVANELDVRLPGSSQRTDEEIAADAAHELRSNIWVPAESIKVSVSHGLVTLEGEVEWHYQKEAAENSVRYLRGVEEVNNQIRVRPRMSPADLKAKITDALLRRAEMDARHVCVEVQGGKIILRGKVYSLAEKLEAERAAWSASGVTEVDNQIVVVRRKSLLFWVTLVNGLLFLLIVIVALILRS